MNSGNEYERGKACARLDDRPSRHRLSSADVAVERATNKRSVIVRSLVAGAMLLLTVALVPSLSGRRSLASVRLSIDSARDRPRGL
jgi:hypothetical protein